jgi:hypothetical protein
MIYKYFTACAEGRLLLETVGFPSPLTYSRLRRSLESVMYKNACSAFFYITLSLWRDAAALANGDQKRGVAR